MNLQLVQDHQDSEDLLILDDFKKQCFIFAGAHIMRLPLICLQSKNYAIF